MAKIPAGASLLFGALADSGRIRQRKNGSYRMILKGVDEINWFTDSPNRAEGKWKPRKLLREWNSQFSNSEPIAQTTLEVDGEKVVVTFEMFKPEMRKGKMIFEFEPILNDPREDLLTGLKGKQLNDISLFIDDATPGVPSCFPNCKDAILKGLDMSGQNLYSDFENANLNNALLNFANLSGADLYGANLNYTKLNEADLHRAYLKGADLTDAELTGAYMNDADLTNANLADANLKGANLAEADLSGANLKGANLTDALWGKTTCPNGTMNSGTSPCTADQLNLA